MLALIFVCAQILLLMDRTVLAFGTFDLLHPGHIDYLRKARRHGSRLVVVVARDESVAKFKGRRPVLHEDERLVMVSSLRLVDKAMLGNRLSGRGDMFRVISKVRPQVIALGYDQRVDLAGLRKWLSDNGINATVVRIRSPLHKGRLKSSLMRKAAGI